MAKTVEEVLGGGPKPKSAKKGKKVRHKTTHIEHHADGSHTVRHAHADGGGETSYAAKNMDELHQGLDENVGGMPAAAGGGQVEPMSSPMPAGTSMGGGGGM